MTTFLNPEQYDNLFSSMSNDELFNAIAQNYASLIGQLQQYKDNPSQMPEIDRNRLASLLKTCIKKTQKAPESLSPNNYFSDISQDNLQSVNESLSYEKKLLGALKTLAPHTTKNHLGKKDFIKVCETARNLDNHNQANVGTRVANGRDTLLSGKTPLKRIPFTYSDKRGVTTTVQLAYDNRYSDENEVRQDAIKELKEKNPLAVVHSQETKKKEQQTTPKQTTYKMSQAQLRGSSYRM